MGPEGPGFVVQAEGTEEQGETNQEQVVLASEVALEEEPALEEASEEASEEEPAGLERFDATILREAELEGDLLEEVSLTPLGLMSM